MSTEFVESLWEEYLNDFLHSTLTTTIYDYAVLEDLSGPQSLQALYDNGNTSYVIIKEAFENMSESLTNYMRLNGQVNQSVPVTGQVLHYATCLNVQWGWIALPAVVVLGTCALLAFTMFAAHRRSYEGMPRWKTTILPILFHGPELKMEGSLVTEASMVREACRINAVIDRGVAGEGFKLVQT